MANYKCEENSSCEYFQSAICLHCNRRLCVLHVAEHNKIVFGEVKNLLNEIKTTFQYIQDQTEKNQNIYNNTLTSLNQWQTKQIEKIKEIYDKNLQLIECEHQKINNTQQNLLKQLERDARQPLELIQNQQNVNPDLVNHIRQTIIKTQDDIEHLTWNYSISSLPNIDNDSLIISSPFLISNINNNELISIEPKNNKNSSISSPSSSCEKLSKGRPFKRLLHMFSNISAIEQTKLNIDLYIEKQRNNFNLPSLVNSYLTAWYQKTKLEDKIYLLNQHISTIQKYLAKKRSKIDVLIGTQCFFSNDKIQGNKSEMMTFLLQYFLNHQCFNHEQIFIWYNNKHRNTYVGFENAKQLAKSFIESLTPIDNTNNIQITVPNQTNSEQNRSVTIKEETTVL